MTGSATIPQPVAEEIVQFGNRVNLGNRLLEVVGNAAEVDRVVLDDDIGGTRISVSRLADGPDVNEDLLFPQIEFESELFRRVEIVIFRKDPGDVGVSLKAILVHQPENTFHFPLVVDVFREDVFIQWIPGRAVNKQKRAFPSHSGEIAEKLPASFIADWISGFQHLPGPEDCPFGSGIETFRIEESRLIVVAKNCDFTATHHQIDAFPRIRSVTDNIPQTVDLLNPLLVDIGQHRFQGFQIAMDIADDCSQRLLFTDTDVVRESGIAE